MANMQRLHVRAAPASPDTPASPDAPASIDAANPWLWLILILILWAALAVRLWLWGADVRFHVDEAFFSTFARRAALNGDWWLSGPLDKPPLSIYLSALSMQFTAVSGSTDSYLQLDVRRGELAARWPAVLAGVVCVALVYALTRRWAAQVRSPADARVHGLLAAVVMMSSPLAVSYSAMALTDAPMLLFWLAALAAAAHQRPTGAGVWLALAVACKQQALLAVPLIALVLLVARPSARPLRAAVWVLLRAAWPLLVMLGALGMWDQARVSNGATVTGFWAQAAANNLTDATFAPPQDWPARALLWMRYAADFFVIVMLTAVGFWTGLSARPRRLLWLVLAYAAGYSVLHIVGALNIYQRYLLPLLPLYAILMGLSPQRRYTTRWRVALDVLMGIALLSLTLRFGNIGEGTAAYQGIDRAAAYLDSRTLGAIVYDRWLGWPLDYYLGQWTDKRRVYYPTPPELVAGALCQPDRAPRYFITPDDSAAARIAPLAAPPAHWVAALQGAGFAPRLVYWQDDYSIYELTPPSGVGTTAACAAQTRQRPLAQQLTPPRLRLAESP
jgi:4-amino-4-deoxy-L-arabinose transferase-like glycosyltransferase